jgi:hypothetical protein
LADVKVKTVRVKLIAKKDKDGNPTTEIPYLVNDPNLHQTVELNPDGILSEDFAKAHMALYAKFEVIGAKDEVNKDEYVYTKEYREHDIIGLIPKLTPEQKDTLFGLAKDMIAENEKKAADALNPPPPPAA